MQDQPTDTNQSLYHREQGRQFRENYLMLAGFLYYQSYELYSNISQGKSASSVQLT